MARLLENRNWSWRPSKDWPAAVEGRKGDLYWDYPDWAGRASSSHVYRGVTSEEWSSIQRTGEIKSTLHFSLPGEGTSFATDAASSLSYAQIGRDNPARTQRPVYVIELKRTETYVSRKGYDYLMHMDGVPTSSISRVWRFNPDGTVDVST
jgi:hypothetical protein